MFYFDEDPKVGYPSGSAERNFGKILKLDLSAYRDELVISTKAGYLMWPGPYGEWGTRKYLLASLDQSLKRLGLDYVDIFYSHRFDPGTPCLIHQPRYSMFDRWVEDWLLDVLESEGIGCIKICWNYLLNYSLC